MGLFDDLVPSDSGPPAALRIPDQPRGLRNNNPGNIEDGPFARSIPGYAGSDGRFAKYDSAEGGQAAMDRLLESYGKRGFNTPASIIGRWAPASDGNPVNNYSRYVAEGVGGDPNAQLDLSDPTIRRTVAERITQFENGQRKSVAQSTAQPIGLFNDLVPQGQGRPPEVGPVVSPEAGTGGRFTDNAGQNFRAAREGDSAPAPLPQGFIDKLVQLWENPPKDRLSLVGMIKSAYEGAILPGDVASGKVAITGEDGRTNPEVIQRSAQLAQAVPMGPAPGGMLAKPSTADQALLANVSAKAPPVPSGAELKAAASTGYQSAEVKNLTIKPEAVQGLSQTITTKLTESGLDENLAPKTFGILSKLDKAPEGAVVTGDNLQSLRRTLGNAASSIDPTERLAAKNAIETLDGFLSNIPKESVIAGDATKAAETLGTARQNYAAAMQAENIDKKAIQAELRAAAANSGQNVANTVRQRMADIILKPAERRGYTGDELAQMEKIVRGGIIDNSLRTVGNLLGGGGGMGAVVTAGVGGMATGGPGAIAPVIGYALKRLGNAMTLRQAEKLSETVRSRAPLAKSMEDFGEKAAQLEAVPGPKSMAAVALASRNLANNLKDAGIGLSVSDIMRSIQGPLKSAADQDQQN